MWTSARDLHERMGPGKTLLSLSLAGTHHHLLWGVDWRQAGPGRCPQADFPMTAVGSLMSLSCASATETGLLSVAPTPHEALQGCQDKGRSQIARRLRNTLKEGGALLRASCPPKTRDVNP